MCRGPLVFQVERNPLVPHIFSPAGAWRRWAGQQVAALLGMAKITMICGKGGQLIWLFSVLLGQDWVRNQAWEGPGSTSTDEAAAGEFAWQEI